MLESNLSLLGTTFQWIAGIGIVVILVAYFWHRNKQGQ